MTKKQARAHFKTLRQQITGLQQQRWDDLLLIRFQTVPLPPLSTLLNFVPSTLHREVNSFLLEDYLRFRNPGMVVAYPRITDGDNMEAVVPPTETDFAPNVFGIPEPTGNAVLYPSQLEAVIVPMLGFDANGQRVGYGKGYYDRYLAQCSDDCIRLGICYFDPLPQITDAGEHDIPLDFCITPHQVYVF